MSAFRSASNRYRKVTKMYLGRIVQIGSMSNHLGQCDSLLEGRPNVQENTNRLQ